jgi:hypothetical protein
VNVWCGLIVDLLIGPFILERLTAVNYLFFLVNKLMQLTQHVPLKTMLRMFFELGTSTFRSSYILFESVHWPCWSNTLVANISGTKPT